MKKVVKKERAQKNKKAEVALGSMVEQLRLSESYMSLLLGILVVLILGLFLFMLLQQRQMSMKFPKKDISQKPAMIKPVTSAQIATYIVVEGDSLKSIALKFYGTSNASLEIAKANHIENPDIIEPGSKLSIPHINQNKILGEGLSQEQKSPITKSSYTVMQGDLLWDIAVRAYGDGYKWTSIAKTNNLVDVDVLMIGTTLTIPR